ncbi:MAG: hypothetical protein AUH01_03705 [Acidobacteria bacterium 13_2_20CM_56_17]|nr:MAG: hypothetical protein AUH01_03705 [Acidobacteria bacterium 13_2_20CM_56_17]
MSGSLANSSAVVAFFAVPSTVIWSYSVGGVVLAIGLAAIFLRGHWQKARGLDKLILLGRTWRPRFTWSRVSCCWLVRKPARQRRGWA